MASRRTLRKTGKYFLAAWVASLLSFGMIAQEVSVEASVSANPVAPGETFSITVTIVNSDGEVNMPRIQGLQFLYGPSRGQNIQTINGVTTREFSYSYGFRAPTEGNYDIPSIKVRTSKGVLETRAFTLSVSQGSNEAVSGNFIVSIEPSKRKVYLGEPVIVRYKIYQKYGNFRPESYEFPELSGFWPEQVTDHQGRWENQLINGQRYQTATLRVDVLFPQKTGTQTLEGFSMTGIVGGIWNRQRVSAVARKTSIEVLPLPPGKPASFVGTYPQLNLEVEPSTTHLKANEALTLKITFSGKGNLSFLQEPEIDWPADLEVYDPEVKNQVSTTANGVSGKITYEYLVIPRTEGRYVIPGMEISWFDPVKETYRKQSTDPIELEVSKGSGSADLNYSFNSKSDVQLLNKDIRHIKSTPGQLRRTSQVFFGDIFYYLAYASPLLLFLAALAYRQKWMRERMDERGTRKRKAGSKAKKWLSEASAYRQDAGAFYTTLLSGLEQYLLDRFGMDRSQLNSRSMQEAIQAEANEDLAKEFVRLYEQCSMARYAPGASGSTEALLKQANQMIETLESLKK